MTTNGITNVLVVGVGGQGILLAGEILSKVALNAGLDVKKSEVHGMAQRGGSVNSQVRFGLQVSSPLIPQGETDILLSFEKLEPLRWLNLCNPKTIAIVNDQSIHSLTTGTGLQVYPDSLDSELATRFKRLYMVAARDIALELGNVRVVNVILLGLLAGMLDFPEAAWTEALTARLPRKLIDVNMAAFERGLALTRG